MSDLTAATIEERLVRGLYSHIHRGGCPDELEGWDSRDVECTACAMLDEMLARFSRCEQTCADCDATTFECSACGSPAALAAPRDQTGTPEVDWPCDFPTPHPPHEAKAYDALGSLMGYTEHCHGGTETNDV